MEARRWPGKYRASGPNKYGDVYVTTDLAGEGMHLVIAEMRIPDPQDLIGDDGGPVKVETSRAMAMETAKVFAAAPDLWEALKLYMAAYDPDGRHHRDNCFATGPMTGDPVRDLLRCPGCAAYEAARAAVTKAKGE